MNLYLYVFGLFSIFVIKPIQPDCDKIKGISVLLLETPLTRSKYFSPYTHAQRLTRTSGTFCTFAYKQTLQGNYPLATYYNDVEATQEAIEIEETDSEDDLSEVSMQTHGDISKAKLKAALQGLTDSHRATANHLSALSTMVTGMTEEQVGETTASVATELGAVQGWQHITQSFDRPQITLVLAVGVRKVEEFEILKGKRAKNDVTPFLRLAKIFGSNTRTIQECNAGIK